MIITEYNFNNIIAESVSTDQGKKLYLKGVFMEAEQRNRNGRTYQLSEMTEQVAKMNAAAESGNPVLGHIDHPEGSLEIKLADVSHKIVEVKMQENNAIGKAQIIDTVPNGMIAKGLIESGINVGVSSRGSGVVNESTGIVEGFDLVTIDLVATPSAINAYPESVLESLDMYKKGNELKNVADAVIHDPMAQKYFNRELSKYIKEIFNK